MTTQTAKEYCNGNNLTEETARTFLKQKVFTTNNVNNLDINSLNNMCEKYTQEPDDKAVFRDEDSADVIDHYGGSYCKMKLSTENNHDTKTFCNNPTNLNDCADLCNQYNINTKDDPSTPTDVITVDKILKDNNYTIFKSNGTSNTIWSELSDKSDIGVGIQFTAIRNGKEEDGTGEVKLVVKDDGTKDTYGIKSRCDKIDDLSDSYRIFGVTLGHTLGQLSGFGSLIDQNTADKDGYGWGNNKIKELQKQLQELKWIGTTKIMKSQVGGEFTTYDEDGNPSNKEKVEGVDQNTLDDIGVFIDLIDRFDDYIKETTDAKLKTLNFMGVGGIITLYVITFVLLTFTVWKLK